MAGGRFELAMEPTAIGLHTGGPCAPSPVVPLPGHPDMAQSSQQNDGGPGLDIKTMKLYSRSDRIFNELKELGYVVGEPLKVEDVSKFDSYHYHGTSATDLAIAKLGIRTGHTILDVGSGLGGPARYLASQTKCHVTAVELQRDLHLLATELTRLCGLSDNVRHVHGDFLQGYFGCEPCDFLVSWLVFLHISDKYCLFDHCRKAMTPGGKIYIEDLFEISAPTSREMSILKEDVYAVGLNSKDTYIGHLKQAGFSDIQFDDVSGDWRQFVHSRSVRYRADRERHVRIHGEEVFTEQDQFYSSVDVLFQGGNIGGCRIVATATPI